MATIKTPVAGVSPYQAAAAATPTVLRAGADGTTVLANPTAATAAAINANTNVIVNGAAALNSLITTGRTGVFEGANVTINLEEQNFNTTNQVTSNTNYPAGNIGEIQFNSGSNSFASNAYFTYDNSNVITPGIRTDGYFYSNGAPFIGGGNAAIGNFVFTGDTMSISDDANVSLNIRGNSLGNNENYITINPTSIDIYAYNTSPYSFSELYLDNGNVEAPYAQIIVDGNSTPQQTWTFDATGNLALAGNINYQVPGLGASGAFGINSWYPVNLTVNDGVGLPFQTWTFDATGGTIFPTLTTQRGDNPSGTISGQTLLFGDATQEAIISTPDGTTGNEYSQRLVINPGAGNDFGEGGDIYLWAGRGGANSGSGGDVKIRGGYAPADGTGGYIRIDGGESQGNGAPGFIEITGGQGGTTSGGYIQITGGVGGSGTGGAVDLIGGFGQAGPGANVGITGGGSANGLAEYGNVNIGSGASTWSFRNNGTTQFPGNLLQTPEGNPLDIKVTTGNVFSTVSLYDTASQLIIQDNTTGANPAWALFEADLANVNTPEAAVILKPGDTGTEVRWTFDATGNITLPGLYGAQLIVNQLGGPGLFTGGATAQPSLNYGVRSNVFVGDDIVLTTDSGNSSWTFGADGNTTFPTGGTISNYPGGIGANNDSWFVTPGNGGTGGVSSQDGQQYIQINNNLYVEIGTSYGTANASVWQFSQNGNFGAPGNISTNGNVSANFFLGNGSQLTGINVATSRISNGTSNINIATANGNVTVTANGSPTWIFDNDGNLVLPHGGSITEGTAVVPGGSANTITLTPSGGGNADQQLLIYPTAGEGNHLHLTSGNLYNTELYLGSDDLYVKLGSNGNVYINANDSLGNTAQWTFGTDGNLTTPGASGNITGADVISANVFTSITDVEIAASGNSWLFNTDGNLILPDNGVVWNNGGVTTLQAGTNGVQIGSQNSQSYVIANSLGVYIQNLADTTNNQWFFRTDGNLQVPGNSYFNTANATGGGGGNSINIKAGASDANIYNSNSGGNILIQGGYGSYGNGNGGQGGNITIQSGGSSDSHHGNINIIADVSTWTFDYSGNLTFPTGNLVIIPDDAAFGNAAVISSADHNLITGSFGANGGTSSLWVEDYANIGSSNIAAVYANPVPGSGNVRIAVGTNGGPGPYLWDFQPNGNLTAPGNISTTGNITGAYFSGNGSGLTGVGAATVPGQNILPTIQTITIADTSGVGNAPSSGQGYANVTVANVISVTEYGVIITSGTSSQKYATGALGNIPGTEKITFTTAQTGQQFTVYAYVTSNAGTFYSNSATGNSGICLLAGTQIALSDGSHKAIEDITYTDKLLSWNFDRGCYAETTALWIKRSETGSQYNLLTFSDGTTLRTFDQHRIFNKQAGAFTYPMTDATPVGTITVNEHGQEIILTNKQVIRDTIDYYNVITDYHMNLFSDSVLTSCRFNNIYPVVDMKFVKDSRTPRTRAEFANIPDRFFHGLRLTEQTADVDAVEWYVDRLVATEVATQVELAS